MRIYGIIRHRLLISPSFILHHTTHCKLCQQSSSIYRIKYKTYDIREHIMSHTQILEIKIHKQNNILALYVVHTGYTQSPKSTVAKSSNYTSSFHKKEEEATNRSWQHKRMTKLAQNA